MLRLIVAFLLSTRLFLICIGVDVWLEYCQYAIGGMGSGEPAELDAVRAVLEEAVANQGLNFAKGAILFEVYREFENICLAQIQSQDVSSLY